MVRTQLEQLYGDAMIFFLCPKPQTPSGGCWFIHRLAFLLNMADRPAKVIQTEPFQIWWDSHPTDPRMIGKLSDLRPTEYDTVVIPEVLWGEKTPVNALNGPHRIVVFVQNRIWLGDSRNYDNGVVEVLVCSRYLKNYMERVHRAKVIGIVRPYLDPDVWHPTPKIANRTLIVARRNPYHEKVKAMLEADGFPVEYVTDPITQMELARRLSTCEFYVHLTHPEGFPMACLEAMRMGTIVVGTTGGGGNEFLFDRETAMVSADPEAGHCSTDDFLGEVMRHLNTLRGDANLRSKMWLQAHNWSLRYTAEATTKELLEVLCE